jgi:hypothetical protein
MLLRAQFNHYCEVVGRASACGAFVTTVAIVPMLALSGSAEARSTAPQPPSSSPPPPKTYTCSCACRAEYRKEVLISNQTISSTVPCSSVNGKTCSATVGSRTASGRWEGCH